MFGALFPLIRTRQRAAQDQQRKQIASGVPAETFERDQCVKNIRGLKRLIVVFALLAVYAIFATQGDPLLPRTAVASFDLLLLAACVYSLLRWQKRLKGLPVACAKDPPDTR